MEALIASYGDSSDSDCSPPTSPAPRHDPTEQEEPYRLPPPPLDLLNPPNSNSLEESQQTGQASRIRNFPHVEGNYALHVYIPVKIPSIARKDLAQFLKGISSLLPGLNVVDADIPVNVLCNDDRKLEQVGLGREFHISLGRTVPIRVHQIESVVAMLRQKLQSQKRYWIDFSKWEIFINDDQTRTFLSVEVISGGLAEITRQIHAVDEIYRLHNLPEFYKDPRPHISLAWAIGDIRHLLRRGIQEMKRNSTTGGSLQKGTFTYKFSGIHCKIGNKVYKICKFPEEEK